MGGVEEGKGMIRRQGTTSLHQLRSQLISENDVAGMDDAGNVSEDGKENVDCEMISTSLLEEYSHWLQMNHDLMIMYLLQNHGNFFLFEMVSANRLCKK